MRFPPVPALLLAVAATIAPASAQVQAIAPLQPIGTLMQTPASTPIQPLPPASAATPAQVLLNQTYRALQSAGSDNRTLAARTAYAAAIQRYHEGDAAGAAAFAAWALAQLPGSRTPLVVEPLAPAAAPPAGLQNVPLLGNGETLPAYIERARDAVLNARFRDGRTRDRALAAIRNAIDSWLDGNPAQARQEAALAASLAAGKGVPQTAPSR